MHVNCNLKQPWIIYAKPSNFVLWRMAGSKKRKLLLYVLTTWDNWCSIITKQLILSNIIINKLKIGFLKFQLVYALGYLIWNIASHMWFLNPSFCNNLSMSLCVSVCLFLQYISVKLHNLKQVCKSWFTSYNKHNIDRYFWCNL